MKYDNRTKPESQWTFYVVDDLPRMSNIYRYDTVEEAIEKYKSLPENLLSAIGSSIHDKSQIDHIHRRDGKSVLVMDCERMKNPIWRESSEIQSAIDTMIAYLGVQHQLSNMFGYQYPSVVVDLERYSGKEMDHYFDDKLLRPESKKDLLTAINEVYVEGNGWMKLEPFLKALDTSRPSHPGDAPKNLFVSQLNINYIDESGHCSQADISPRNFELLKARTEREVAPEKLAEDLYQFAEDHDPYEALDQKGTKEEQLQGIKRDIQYGYLHHYVEYVSDCLSEARPSDDMYRQALSLLSRLTVLTPKEFRKPALDSMIRKADHESQQHMSRPQHKATDKER